MAKLTIYVQATAQTYEWNGVTHVRGPLTLANVTVKKPQRPVAGAKVVKVVLNIADSVFGDNTPTINLDVPDNLVAEFPVAGSVEPVDG